MPFFIYAHYSGCFYGFQLRNYCPKIIFLKKIKQNTPEIAKEKKIKYVATLAQNGLQQHKTYFKAPILVGILVILYIVVLLKKCFLQKENNTYVTSIDGNNLHNLVHKTSPKIILQLTRLFVPYLYKKKLKLCKMNLLKVTSCKQKKAVFRWSSTYMTNLNSDL